jgi:hypothetical protein
MNIFAKLQKHFRTTSVKRDIHKKIQALFLMIYSKNNANFAESKLIIMSAERLNPLNDYLIGER